MRLCFKGIATAGRVIGPGDSGRMGLRSAAERHTLRTQNTSRAVNRITCEFGQKTQESLPGSPRPGASHLAGPAPAPGRDHRRPGQPLPGSGIVWWHRFFTQMVLTWTGWRDCFLLPFIHIDTRRVFVTQCTRKPDAAWVKQQARAILSHLIEIGQRPQDTILFGTATAST